MPKYKTITITVTNEEQEQLEAIKKGLTYREYFLKDIL